MPFSHQLLALSVVFVWGTNFVVIAWGLAEFPPFLFTVLRFALSALPWVFLLRRPAVPWTTLAAFGTLIGAGQFGLLYWAMQRDITPGVASLVIQSQVFFTILLSMLLNGERLTRLQGFGLALAGAGYATVAWRAIGAADTSITLLGLSMALAAAFSWACANLVVRRLGRIDMLAFTVWSSLYAIVPVLILSLVFEGPELMLHALSTATWSGWSAAIWQGVGNTLFGFGVWNWLLARHPAATVAPSALLVPIFGMLSSAWLLGESLPAWKIMAALLVLAGLAVNLHASRVRSV